MWIIPKNLLTYPYVQDTVELILDFQELSEVLQQSVMSKSKPSQSKTWFRRLKTGGLIQHLSTQTLKPSHSPNFEDAWTSSLEASLANPFPVQGEKEEMKIQDTSFPTYLQEQEQQGFQFSFSKTSQESSPQNSKPTDGTTQSEHPYCSMSLESWKEQVTSVRGAYSVRKKSVLPIKENEFLFLQYQSNSPQMVLTPSVVESAMNWATPNTMDSLPPRSAEATRRMASGIRKGRSAPCNLREQVDPHSTQIYKEMREKIRQNWPTPKALEVDESVKHWKIRREKPKAKKMGPSLTVATKIHAQEQTQKNWATPNTRDWKGAQSAGDKERGYGDLLPDQVERRQANWPTPLIQEAGPLLKTLTNKDGTPWDGVGRAYRPSGVKTSVGLTQCIEYLERQPTLEGGEGSSTVGNHQELQSSPRKKAWATPTARDWKGAEGRAYLKQGGTDLPSQTEKNWATPISTDYKNAGVTKPPSSIKGSNRERHKMPLQVLEEEKYKGKLNPRWVETLMGLPVGWVMPSCSTLVTTEQTQKNWATPIVRDYMEAGMLSQLPSRKDGASRLDTTPRQVLEEADYKGKLNPRWVETLMGLPVGWVMPSCLTLVTTERTSLDSLEMESSPTQQQKHSEHYGENWSTPTAHQNRRNVKTYLSRNEKRLQEGKPLFSPKLETQVEAEEVGVSLDIRKESCENWSTPRARQRGENVKAYLSRCEKLLQEGRQLFSPMLQTQVEAEEMGVSLDVRKEGIESPWAEYQLVIDGRRIIPKTCPPKKKCRETLGHTHSDGRFSYREKKPKFDHTESY